MTQAIPVLFLAALILILSVRVLLQSFKSPPNVTVEDYAAARSALDSVLLEAAAVKRILAEDDVAFIKKNGASSLQQLFLSERKKLLLFWLRTTRKRVKRLMDVHLKLASYTHEPSPQVELRLTLDYVSFLLVSSSTLLLIWLFGPFAMVRIVNHMAYASDHFASAFGFRLGDVDPVKLGTASQVRSL